MEKTYDFFLPNEINHICKNDDLKYEHFIYENIREGGLYSCLKWGRNLQLGLHRWMMVVKLKSRGDYSLEDIQIIREYSIDLEDIFERLVVENFYFVRMLPSQHFIHSIKLTDVFDYDDILNRTPHLCCDEE